MFSLKNKAAFITGGSSGIGLGVAKAYVELGANVAIADISDGTDCAKEIGAHYVRVDVSDESSVQQAMREATEQLGSRLDVVVLNAGIGDVGPTFEQTDQALIDKLTRINQWGVLYGLKHAPAFMNDLGSILSTASMAAFINMPGSGVDGVDGRIHKYARIGRLLGRQARHYEHDRNGGTRAGRSRHSRQHDLPRLYGDGPGERR
jgi:NAD(P)-dependent dehydrogenase (short-subunit alcohol dehydrogenase family)